MGHGAKRKSKATGLTPCSFSQFLIDQTPVFDAAIMESVRDGWFVDGKWVWEDEEPVVAAIREERAKEQSRKKTLRHFTNELRRLKKIA